MTPNSPDENDSLYSRCLALRADVGAALAAPGTLSEMLQRCAEVLARDLEAPCAWIWTMNPETAILELQARAGTEAHGDRFPERIPAGDGLIGEIVAARQPRVTAALPLDLRPDDPHCGDGDGTFAGYPLLIEERVVGVMALYTPVLLAQKPLVVLDWIAHAMAQGIERKRAEAALVEAHQELEQRTAELARANEALRAEVAQRRKAEQVAQRQAATLARTVTALTAQPDLQGFLHHVLGAIAAELEADGVSIRLHDPATDRLTFRAGFVEGRPVLAEELEERGVAETIPANAMPLWEQVARTRRPAAVEDLAPDSPVPFAGALLALGIRSSLTVPLLFGEQPIGCLLISHRRPRRYPPEEIDLAQALGQHVVGALQLARLAEQDRQATLLAERNRMAREIHDTLAQGFTGIVLQLQAAEKALACAPDRATPYLQRALNLAKESLAEARRSVWALRPGLLEDGALPEALAGMAERMTSGTGIRPAFRLEGTPLPLAAEQETHLLRIGQEAVTNALKYSGASALRIALEFQDGTVRLRVSDDGRGFDPDGPPVGGGFGLTGMRERAERIGGALRVRTAPGAGTEVLVDVPLVAANGIAA